MQQRPSRISISDIIQDRDTHFLVDGASGPGAVVPVGVAVADEMEIGAQASDVAVVAEELHDLTAGVGGGAVVAAVLGDDDAAVVVEADQVAGAHFCWESVEVDWLVGGIARRLGVSCGFCGRVE